ncbi:MAG TPA: TOBE domain-containing protein [Candidatus Methanofastidiosa archaeon]|nr:TOBE domain-containing protein [Candidatus Methanofastidiosa archaeon]
MNLSARNVLKGTVVDMAVGAVNNEVSIKLPGGEIITSIITKSSAERLKIEKGKEVYAIIKASNVMIGTD